MASCPPYTEIHFGQEIDNSWFCIGSSDGLYVVELATSELLTVLYFKDTLLIPEGKLEFQYNPSKHTS
ncbi:hypothetical protein ATANTOWER_030487 [Ataeniobius toweri]|uniref:Uncharacterized protein n=1 Tax=Ataeniobius toweri TaxID=208326 RepID=A0ABU7A8K3_9TELE|nr:hypothetical protein [Ataeniobius toweri]